MGTSRAAIAVTAALAALAVAAVAGEATAAPAADLVVVWAPGASPAEVAKLTDAARKAGAAPIDRSPAPPVAPATYRDLARGIEAFDALRVEDAQTALDAARAAADTTGADGLTTAQLSDLFLYRGLVHAQQGESAWDDLVTAATLDPARVLDPARFPPHVVTDWERAKAAAAAEPRAALSIEAPAGCAITVDGTRSAATASVVAGAHWVHVACADRAPWGARVAVTAPSTTITADAQPLAAPGDTDLAIQARTAGARAIVVAEVRGAIGTARLVDASGRERDRRSVTLPASGDLAPLAGAIAAMLQPPPPVVTSHLPPATPWYRTKWAYAAAAAIVAAAVLVPTTAIIAGGGPATTATVKVGSVPVWGQQ
nr:hypothetical protein [Kofleriaceae bacterium]